MSFIFVAAKVHVSPLEKGERREEPALAGALALRNDGVLDGYPCAPLPSPTLAPPPQDR